MRSEPLPENILIEKGKEGGKGGEGGEKRKWKMESGKKRGGERGDDVYFLVLVIGIRESSCQ